MTYEIRSLSHTDRCSDISGQSLASSILIITDKLPCSINGAPVGETKSAGHGNVLVLTVGEDWETHYHLTAGIDRPAYLHNGKHRIVAKVYICHRDSSSGYRGSTTLWNHLLWVCVIWSFASAFFTGFALFSYQSSGLITFNVLIVLWVYAHAQSIESTPGGSHRWNFYPHLFQPNLLVPVASTNSGNEAVLKIAEQVTPGLSIIQDPAICHAHPSTIGAKTTATTITSSMGIEEIMRRLVEHGCQDITHKLKTDQLSNRPAAWGGFGAVFRTELQDNIPVAVKYFYKLDCLDAPSVDKILKRTAREIYPWSKCNHPGILPLYGIARIDDHLALVSPWMRNGSLSSFLRNSSSPVMDRLQLCLQMASALDYMHSRGIVHGDIKPDNVVVSDNNTPLFSDFGNAKVMHGSTLQFTETSCFPVTVRYAAPEVLQEDTTYTTQADVYAFGMTVLEVLTGKIPFDGIESNRAVVVAVIAGKIPDRNNFLLENKAFKDRLWELLTQCWTYKPQGRPTAIALLEELTLIYQHSRLH